MEGDEATDRAGDVNAEFHVSVALTAKRRRKRLFDSSIEARNREERVVSFRIPTIKKSEASEEFIRGALQRSLFLSHLASSQLEAIVKAMKLRKVAGSTVMYDEGDVGDRFYIIQTGVFTFYKGANKETSEARGG